MLITGDGANDVSMIQVADVGVGISGQEGMQVRRYVGWTHGESDTKTGGVLKSVMVIYSGYKKKNQLRYPASYKMP